MAVLQRLPMGGWATRAEEPIGEPPLLEAVVVAVALVAEGLRCPGIRCMVETAAMHTKFLLRVTPYGLAVAVAEVPARAIRLVPAARTQAMART